MSSDKFFPIPFDQLVRLVLKQIDEKNQIFGIPRKLFHKPEPLESINTTRYGQLLETPIGVAAGPHTQMAQNIIAAWLAGARFIELKTIQTLDELEISKPCIDMQDEGYNCEWSQELKVEESFNQYLDAWILIHILKDKLALGDQRSPGVIFNMSVGYNLEGIMKENVQWFFKKMNDASEELAAKVKSIETIYPNIKNLTINPQISNNVTLSTMHGCPPDEIEKIGHYLLTQKKLHTAIKLNPTLLGKDELQEILRKAGFETDVPDIAFEHDLKYGDAINIIKNLQKTAIENDLHFSIKLTNTLESVNHKDVFPKHEKMMYMSGRALHPISVNVAAKLQKEFDGKLNISFCGGANAFNISDLVACGLSPITVCSDILKPGGYSRLTQYIFELRKAFDESRVNSVDDFIRKQSRAGVSDIHSCIISNISRYSQGVTIRNDYRKTDLHDPSIKTSRALGFFDCIHAPCEDTCPTNQNIPGYNFYTSRGDIAKAGEIILQTNPFPQTTGMICDHLCQTKCTRINYDSPVLIREIKRYLAETAIVNQLSKPPKQANKSESKTVAVIGAGPSGLSCAYFLALAGFKVNVYESKKNPGGMVSGVIPPFRLTDEAIANDVERVKSLGVEIHYGVCIDSKKFGRLRREADYIFIAAGAQDSARLKIDGINTKGVVDPLELLEKVKRGQIAGYGKRIAIIGGGNTAMDVARTAHRLVGDDGKVFVIYRRTIKEMPADLGEIKAVMDEGVEVMELVAPEKVVEKNGKISALRCSRMKLGEKDNSGRRSPVKIPNSEFDLDVNTIIPAVGQQLSFDFGENNLLISKPGVFETQIPNIFIGGDALRGASTAINAIGDGRKVAQMIIDREGVDFNTQPKNRREPMDWSWHMQMRSTRVHPQQVKETPLQLRKNFELVSSTLTEDEVIDEAKRCLLCDEVCSICTTVCPNLANYTYEIEPVKIQIYKAEKLTSGEIKITPDGIFEVNQKHQIINIANFCNECGNCNTFCPSSGAPYMDKPKLYLTQSSFNAAESGYFLEKVNGVEKLQCKGNAKLFSLSSKSDGWLFEGDGIEAVLSRDHLNILSINFKDSGCNYFDTRLVATMSVIISGALEVIVE